MSKIADSIKRGLHEAVSYARGEADRKAYRVHVPARVNVKAIRNGLIPTQDEFAAFDRIMSRKGGQPPAAGDEIVAKRRTARPRGAKQ